MEAGTTPTASYSDEISSPPDSDNWKGSSIMYLQPHTTARTRIDGFWEGTDSAVPLSANKRGGFSVPEGNDLALGQWFGLEVSDENKKQIWAPYGFARGFCALTDDCEVQYKCTGIYNPKGESGINFADPEIGVQWPIPLSTAVTSDKDRQAQTLARWLDSPLSDNITYQAR